jgi:hypothetical protein
VQADSGVTCTPGVFDARLSKLGEINKFNMEIGNLFSDERKIDVYLTTPYNFKERYYPMPNQKQMVYFNQTYVMVPGEGAKTITVYIDIPDEPENYGKHWETWITIEAEPKVGEMIKTRVFSRMLVTTPDSMQFNIGISSTILYIIIGSVAVIVCVAGVLWLRKKRSESDPSDSLRPTRKARH